MTKVKFSNCCVCSKSFEIEIKADKKGNTKRKNNKVNQPPSSSSKINDVIEDQLFVIYFVSKLLEIPFEVCSEYLVKYGQPLEWLSFCDDCKALVSEGKNIFREIVKLQAQHKAIQNQVKCLMSIKIKEEINSDKDDDDDDLVGFHFSPKRRKNAENDIRQLLGFPDDQLHEIGDYNEDDMMVMETSQLERNSNSRPKRMAVAKNSKHDMYYESHSDYDDGDGDDVDSTSEDLLEQNKDCEWIRPTSIEDENNKIQHESSDYEDEDEDEFVIKPSKFHKSKTKTSKLLISKSVTTRPRSKRVKKVAKSEDKKANTQTKTLEEVIKLRDEMVSKIPQITKHSSQQEKNDRLLELRKYNISKMVKKYNIKVFPCKFCPTILNTHTKWQHHINIDCDNKPVELQMIGKGYSCEQCGKSAIATLSSLEDHTRLHVLEAEPHLFKCCGCQIIFKQCTKYSCHINSSAPDSECVKTVLKCAKCRAGYYQTQELLDIHNKIRHSDEYPHPYKCSECGKTFRSRGHYNKHLPHTATFQCEICGNRHNNERNLKAHKRVAHTVKSGPPPEFPCPICKTVFSVKKNLVRHLKIHGTESPYLCTICGKSFKIQNYLTIHMWSHDPDRKLKYSLYKPREKKKESIYRRKPRRKIENEESEIEDEGSENQDFAEDSSLSADNYQPTPTLPDATDFYANSTPSFRQDISNNLIYGSQEYGQVDHNITVDSNVLI